VVVIFSIFLLPPLRAYFENQKRRAAIHNYLLGARGVVRFFSSLDLTEIEEESHPSQEGENQREGSLRSFMTRIRSFQSSFRASAPPEVDSSITLGHLPPSQLKIWKIDVEEQISEAECEIDEEKGDEEAI
jgi:hypothetical protein